MKKTLAFSLMTLILIGGGCFGKKAQETGLSEPVEIDRDAILFEARENGVILSVDEIETMSGLESVSVVDAKNPSDIATYVKAEMKDWSSAALADVTGGASYGLAHATFESGVYTVVVDMGSLDELSETFSYQGWLVKRGEGMMIVSVGTAVKTETGYALVYTASQDLSDYNFFVLTLEQTAGLLTPEEHILEGSFR